MSEPTSLFTHPLHLGLGGKALPQPEFDGMSWYEAYTERTAADGGEGRLVSLHRFDADWESWEMHPEGDEVVLCLEGSMVLHQEQPDGSTDRVTLGPGDYAVNGPGVWHTADVAGEALALFITVGSGTTHRPR
jgi:mannose-6-phosphate isomerase-like protein (cupin superfamily)